MKAFIERYTKAAFAGFLFGIIICLFMMIQSGHLPFFRIQDGIPEYILRSIPRGIIKCVKYGLIGTFVSVLFILIKNGRKQRLSRSD